MPGEVIVIGGPNGAGKTTLALEYQSAFRYPYLSADAVATALDPVRPERARIQAGRLLRGRIETLVSNGESFIVESTLSGRAFEGTLTRTKQTGFRVRIVFCSRRRPSCASVASRNAFCAVDTI